MDAAEFQGLVAESRAYRRYGARPLRRGHGVGQHRRLDGVV